MEYKELQNIVISLIKSDSLKKVIKQTEKIFEPIELVKIAFDYAASYDQRLNLLELMKINITEKRLKEYIEQLIKIQKQIYIKFMIQDEKYVYELHIKENPNSYDERYLCDSYSSAIEMIDF